MDDEGREKKGDWGRMAVLEVDYFERDWEKEVQGWEKDGGGFDVIYDNTVSATSSMLAVGAQY